MSAGFTGGRPMNARILSDIRRLCSLGLPLPALAAALAPVLRETWGSSSAGFTRLGPDGRLDAFPLTDEPLPEDIPILYHDDPDTARRLESVVCQDLWSFLRSPLRVQNTVDFPRDFYRSPLYEYIFVPQDIHHALRVALRVGTQPVGCLHLSRTPKEPAYTRGDADAVAALAPWLAHALASDAASDVGDEQDPLAEEGTLILDRHGCVQYRCPTGARLLHMLMAPRGGYDHEGRQRAQRILDGLAARCLDALAGRGSAPSSWNGATAWGWFSLHATPLFGDAAERPSLLSVQIRRRMPRAVGVAVALTGRDDLSPRQKDICLALAQGLTRAEIAGRLGVGVNTVITHVRDLYARLGASDRDDALRLVLGTTP
jgi:DNA-binding CsgD family transcriptional regulator